MSVFNIKVRNKIASVVGDMVFGVCYNKDYVVNFDFDDEWEPFRMKTLRVNYGSVSVSVLFSDNQCELPIITESGIVEIGVFAGDLHTTTSASVIFIPSIMDKAGPEPDPYPDVYEQIIALLQSKYEVAMRVTDTYIQYSNDGITWIDLIALEELKGPKGDPGDPGDLSNYYTKEEVDEITGPCTYSVLGRAMLKNGYGLQGIGGFPGAVAIKEATQDSIAKESKRGNTDYGVITTGNLSMMLDLFVRPVRFWTGSVNSMGIKDIAISVSRISVYNYILIELISSSGGYGKLCKIPMYDYNYSGTWGRHYHASEQYYSEASGSMVIQSREIILQHSNGAQNPPTGIRFMEGYSGNEIDPTVLVPKAMYLCVS